MYQALLTKRYLTTKIMPFLAVLAVTGCTATVLIVWSIMGGFLSLLLDSGRAMVGDVTISWPTVGFPYYDDLAERLEEDAMVAAAAPVIRSFGLANLPDNRVEGVEIMGIDGESFARATGFSDALWWRHIEEPLKKDKERNDPRLASSRNDAARRLIPEFDDETYLEALYEQGVNLEEFDPETNALRPAVVLGIELSGFSMRQADGWYEPAGVVYSRTEQGRFSPLAGFICNHKITLNVLPTDGKGRGLTVVSRRLPVANEFRSGVFEFDRRTVLIRLDELQRMLKMDQGVRVSTDDDDDFGGFETERAGSLPDEIEPARVTSVIVKGADGVDPEVLRERCLEIYREFEAAHRGEVPPPPPPGQSDSSLVTTFERQQRTLVAAVQKETALVLGILIFISLVVSFLILSIFWSMVSEKTKDIGILRAVGASRFGIAWVWLRYGIVIGIAGSVLGGLLAYTIVRNINPIHDWLGRAFNLTIWDPQVYYLFEIPNKVEPLKAAIVLSGGLVLSALGALIPAWRAAAMDPVKSLRFE